MKNSAKLFLFNSSKRKKEEFIPIDQNKVTMYVCGPTLYDNPHLGNARPLIVFDVLFRVLQQLFKEVIYVRNITDIDDKIINKANASKISTAEVVNNSLKVFKDYLTALNILPPTYEPLATNNIVAMLDIIRILLEKGYAYTKEGHVLFNTAKFSSYGALSGRVKEHNTAGFGNDSVAKNIKINPEDFVLWKPSKQGEPAWDSLFGKGRPGWHIECSAMAFAYLGKQFDIHGGGSDLLFPHHENERAQTMAAFGCNFMANYWLHNAFINIDNQKMSKSLGNIVNIDNILKSYNGEILRLAILLTHYRHPINFNEGIITNAKTILDKIYNTIKIVEENNQATLAKALTTQDDAKEELINSKFMAALLDDLNTPLAISELQKITTSINKASTVEEQIRLVLTLKNKGALLGILQQSSKSWFGSNLAISIETIENLIKERQVAKKNKDYQTADNIRQQLLEANIILEDTKDGSTWKKV